MGYGTRPGIRCIVYPCACGTILSMCNLIHLMKYVSRYMRIGTQEIWYLHYMYISTSALIFSIKLVEF